MADQVGLKRQGAADQGPGRCLRTRLLRLAVIVGVVMLSWLLPAGGRPTAHTGGRPNFVLIVTDDQRWDTVDAMPTLSELPARNFLNAYVTTPLCCPSRASILTGQYAHHHGVRTNETPAGGFGRFEDTASLATLLHAAGYRTALVGKYLNGYEGQAPMYVPPGWDEWFAYNGLGGERLRPDRPLEALGANYGYYNYSVNDNGRTQPFGSSEVDYSTDVFVRRAEQFVRTTNERPFFLYLALAAPHLPARPAARHAEAFSEIPPSRPASYNEPDVSDKPRWLAQRAPLTEREQVAVDQFRRQQLAALLSVDEGLARILTALRETGQLERTVLLFISDNGLTWGEHRIPWDKECPYQECLRVPLLISYPPLTPVRADDERIALNIDLAPTLTDLAGLPVPAWMDGASLAPLFDGRAAAWRSDFLVEGWELSWPEGEQDYGETDYAGVLSEAWSYVEYGTGEVELYDLVQDRYQLTNLAGQLPYAARRDELAARLAALREEGGVRRASGP